MSKNNYLAILGGLLGALIGTIPWILVYVYANYILSVLAFLIAFCSLKGYNLLGGVNQKNTSFLIIIFSIVAITIATFIGIPMLLNIKNGLGFSFLALKDLYLNQEVLSSLIKDYLISLLFTFLGISGVVKNLKNNYLKESNIELQNEKIQEIIEIFKNHQAINKNQTISKWELEKEIDLKSNQDVLNYLKNRRIIVGFKQLYLDEKAYTDPIYADLMIKKQRNKLIIILTLIIVLIISLIIIFNNNHDNSNNNSSDTNTTTSNYRMYQFLDYASYELPSYLTIYEDNTDLDFYNQYQYFSITYTPLLTYRKDPMFKTVYVDYLDNYYYEDFEEYKDFIYEKSTNTYKVLDVIYRTDINNFEVIEIKATGTEGRIYRDYYIFYNNDSLFFEFISYDTYSLDDLEIEIMKVLESIQFRDNNMQIS